MQTLLVEFTDIFAENRFDFVYKTKLKVKLTSEHGLPVFVQSLPIPICLRKEISVELALMQYCGFLPCF